MLREQQKWNISGNKASIQVIQVISYQVKLQLIHISKISGNDNSDVSNYKLANKAQNENLRCHKINKSRTFPCGNIILLGIKIISQNFVSYILPQKKL